MNREFRAASFSLALAACSTLPPTPTPTPTSTSTPTPTPTPTSTPTSTPAPPIVLSLVVDQFAAWLASERLPLLPSDGGFARLLREGTYARDARYAHSATDTAPGHAALYTGSVPRVSGIWGNEVLDPARPDAKVSILRDDATKLVTSDGATSVGSSAKVLAIDTVADRLRAASPAATIVALSLKDRGAIFAGGRAPTASVWFDKSLDRFVTSTAFATSLPAWAAPLSSPNGVRAIWTLLDAPWAKSHAVTPDDQDGEGDLGGMGITFPHDVAHARDPANAFRATPFADDALFALALAAMDATRGADPKATRFYAVSLSANDYVGHTFGPDSWEAWDELRRLDASLARFFAALDARFGADGWSAILSGDHGTTTMPEVANGVPAARPWCAPGAKPDRWERACGKVGRLMSAELVTELRDAGKRAIGRDGLVAGVIDPYVYLTPDARSLASTDAKKLRDALARALLAHAEVDRVIDTRIVPAACPPETDASVDALVCRAFVPGKSGDLYVVAKRGSFFDPDVVVGKGTSHGSPYVFDRSVPILVRAPHRALAGKVIDAPVSFRTFARTLATLLGVDPADPDAARALDLAPATP